MKILLLTEMPQKMDPHLKSVNSGFKYAYFAGGELQVSQLSTRPGRGYGHQQCQ